MQSLLQIGEMALEELEKVCVPFFHRASGGSWGGSHLGFMSFGQTTVEMQHFVF